MRIYIILVGIVAFAAAFSIFKGGKQSHSAHQGARILSTNSCVDQALVEIASPQQIISLSHYSKDKTSNPFYEKAKKNHFNNGEAETILDLRPNIIFKGGFEKSAFIKASENIGAQTFDFPMPSSIKESIFQIRQIGELTQNSDKAERLISQINAMEHHGNSKSIRALVLFEGGNTAGENTLINDVLLHMGFDNIATHYGIGNWGKVDLEKVITNPPEIIILANDPAANTIDNRLLNHAALKNKGLNIARISKSYTYCGGPVLPLLMAQLSEIRGHYEK